MKVRGVLSPFRNKLLVSCPKMDQNRRRMPNAKLVFDRNKRLFLTLTLQNEHTVDTWIDGFFLLLRTKRGDNRATALADSGTVSDDSAAFCRYRLPTSAIFQHFGLRRIVRQQVDLNFLSTSAGHPRPIAFGTRLETSWRYTNQTNATQVSMVRRQ